MGHLLFEAKDVVISGRKCILLCDFLSSGLGPVPCSLTDRQASMQAFVAATGLQDVVVKTYVPIQHWRSKLRPCPFETTGLVFVPARRRGAYASERKFKWQVVRGGRIE